MRGKFLDGMDAGMMDHFKQKVEEFLSSFLPLEIERLYQQHKYDAVIVSVMCFSGLIRLMSWHWLMVCMPLTIQVRHKKRFCNIPCLCVSTGK